MIRLIAFFWLLPIGLMAAPKVIADIAPIHSLTAQVMGNLGSPDLLLPPGADPHDFSLRPSDAQRLTDADVVIWVGHGLTPWLEWPLDALAPQATKIELLESTGWDPIKIDEHDDGHDHGDIDPHGWLDPVIAQVWIGIIADALIAADPQNAQIYRDNATNAVAKIDILKVELSVTLAAYHQSRFILSHDGYRYFQRQFGLAPVGYITGMDGRAPGPAHIAGLRDRMRSAGVTCVFSDAEVGSNWVALVTEGTNAKTTPIDATGAGLEPGPALYPRLMREMAASFYRCLEG